MQYLATLSELHFLLVLFPVALVLGLLLRKLSMLPNVLRYTCLTQMLFVAAWVVSVGVFGESMLPAIFLGVAPLVILNALALGRFYGIRVHDGEEHPMPLRSRFTAIVWTRMRTNDRTFAIVYVVVVFVGSMSLFLFERMPFSGWFFLFPVAVGSIYAFALACYTSSPCKTKARSTPGTIQITVDYSDLLLVIMGTLMGSLVVASIVTWRLLTYPIFPF